MVTMFVRASRYTYSCLMGSSDFTLNVPEFTELGCDLAFCGKNSGRWTNKIDECLFTMVESRKVVTPIIAECPIHLECKILTRDHLWPCHFASPEIVKEHYKEADYHMAVMAEIVEAYEN